MLRCVLMCGLYVRDLDVSDVAPRCVLLRGLYVRDIDVSDVMLRCVLMCVVCTSGTLMSVTWHRAVC